MKYSYRTKGTCSQQIDLEINDDVITNVKFYGGCDGNLKAIPILVDGLTIRSPKSAPVSSADLKTRPARTSSQKQFSRPKKLWNKEQINTRVFETIHT